MNDFRNNFRFVLRLCLIAGVLAGLCFSSSEGVRLLPFPGETAGKREAHDVSFGGGKSKKYSFSVHNSAVKLVKNGGNAQNNIKFFDRANNSLREPLSAELFRNLSDRIKFEPVFLESTGLTAAPSNRAPPLV